MGKNVRFWTVCGAVALLLTAATFGLVERNALLGTEVGAQTQPDPPVRQQTRTVTVTKGELLQQLHAAERADAVYLQRLEHEGGQAGRAEAGTLRAQLAAHRRHIEALPEGPIQLEVPVVEVGSHSISFSRFTYDYYGPTVDPNGTFHRKDPINLVFYNRGAPGHVDYALNNWTSKRWQDTTCGSTQWVYIWDAMHTNGRNAWRQMQYQLQPTDAGACGTARYHLRLFGAFVKDSHGQYGRWSVMGAHHDDATHSCTDGWDGPQQLVEDSFRNGSGQPLSFVGRIYKVDIGNAGTYQCADNDGLASFIEVVK